MKKIDKEKLRNIVFNIVKIREDCGYDLQDSIHKIKEIKEYLEIKRIK